MQLTDQLKFQSFGVIWKENTYKMILEIFDLDLR